MKFDEPVDPQPMLRLSPADDIARHPIESELARVQNELSAVQRELDELRERDQALKCSITRMDEELKLAARVQQDFLPRSLPQVPGVRFWSLYRPAGFVSGDLYDVMRLDESHVGLYMADAVGHGMPAALLSMFLKNALVTKEILAGGYRLLTPSEALARLNDALVSQNLSQATFATAVYAVLDTSTRTLTVSRGGHPNPLRLTRSGELQVLQTEGSLLGIFPDEQFAETTIALEPGDRIFLFTDGIEVALCRDLSLDVEQWRHEILARRELPTGQLIHEIAALIDQANPQLRDDLTMIVMDVDGLQSAN